MEMKDLIIYLVGIITTGLLLKTVFGLGLATSGLMAFLGITLIFIKFMKTGA